MPKMLQAVACAMTLTGVMFLSNSSASAETIDLNAAPTGTFSSLTLGDYVLSFVGYGDEQAVVNVNGNNVLEDSDQTNGYGAGIEITRVDGGAFTLNSADIGSNPNGFGAYNIQIGNSFYTNVPTSLTTVNPSGTTDVTGVFVNIVDLQSGYEVTNLNVSSVTPEPSSFLLLGTGLLGMAAAVRRRLV